MTNPSVADYAVQRLSDLGIDRAFGVPGDYAFPIDSAIETCPTLQWIGCANELNAAYAADGYARRKGAAILSTTYGVGELSALNGVMGSRAHRLPVFHLVGAPAQRIVRSRRVTHHTLGDGRFGNFERLSAAACCVSASLTPDNAIDELERVIREALRQSAPAYIVIPMDYAQMPLIGAPAASAPLASIKRQRSTSAELDAALDMIVARLKAAQCPVALPAALLARYGLRDKAIAFLAKSGMRYATTPMDKGVVGESPPNFLGIYAGEFSFPSSVKAIVESADLLLDIGGMVDEDLNTGMWSDAIDPARVIRFHDTWVEADSAIFSQVSIDDMLQGLLERASDFVGACAGSPIVSVAINGARADRLGSDAFYPRLQQFLRQGDILVVETGACMTHLASLKLPEGVDYEAQTLWGSIGWATPAALGVAVAEPRRRTVLVTGDGAHQLTLNELGVMGRYDVRPVIFVINNSIYGIEDVLSERGHEYNNIALIDYHLLPPAMRCEGWLVRRVSTVGELEDALAAINAHETGAYIEVMIPETESQPLPRAIIDRTYRLRTPRVG